MNLPEIAFPQKSDVDDNYFALAKEMLLAKKARAGDASAFGTHDISIWCKGFQILPRHRGLARGDVEVQMLYGIQSAEQERLAREGYNSRVLVAYGTHWYAWFIRRLAERPANLWFVARNLFTTN